MDWELMKMYMGDSIFQVLAKYDYELLIGNESVPNYLEKHLGTYLKDIENSAIQENPFLGEAFSMRVSDTIPFIKQICGQIVDISKNYRAGFIKKAYCEAYELFETMSRHFLTRFSWRESSGFYYRIRQGDFRITDPTKSKQQKAKLFHISDNLRSIIGAYRYSVPGFPCLYLSSGIELAWFECGMPRNFSFCQMGIDEDGEDALRLVDFSNRPIDLLSNIHVWLLNAKENEDEKEKIYTYLLNYIITYPLAAACSMKVAKRNRKFVEEYVIPQIFMQWIRENESFDGVRYKSSLNTNLVQGMGAINIALPVKAFRADGLCENLTSKIAVSDIGYFDVDSAFEEYRGYVDKIEEFKNNIISKSRGTNSWYHYMSQLVEISETIIKTYRSLMQGECVDMDLIFSHIDCCHDYVSTLFKSKQVIIDDCNKQAQHEPGSPIDETQIVSHIDEFHELAMKVLNKHIVFHFQFEQPRNYEKI